MKNRVRIFAASVLVGILVLGILPLAEAVIPPPTVRYKYAFADDPEFDTDSPGSGSKWKTGTDEHGGSLWDESYTNVGSGKWNGRLKTSASWLMGFDVVYVNQGLKQHSDTYASYFKGSNANFDDAVPVEAVVFNLNGTSLLSTDWKICVRTKLTRKDALQPEGVAFNLGIGFGFQFEYRDNAAGKYFLSDYTNPDVNHGNREKPWTTSAILSDIMLVSEHFGLLGWPPFSWSVWYGSGTHNSALDYSDVVNNRYYGLDTTLDPGTWVNFEIPLEQRIQEVFGDVQTFYDQQIDWLWYYGEYYDIDLTSLILRNIALYIEGVNVDVEAQVDYVWFSSVQNDAGSGGDAGNSFDSANLVNPSTPYTGKLIYPGDNDDWYKFWSDSGYFIAVQLTSFQGANFDLELYSPSNPNSPRAGSYSPTDYDVIAFQADDTGWWRARFLRTSGSGAYSFAVYVSGSYGSGGGCPYVSTWDGNEYLLDNNLMPSSETSGEVDVTDYYLLQQMLQQRQDGTYSLLLSEFENEHGYFDRVQLLAVDHSTNANIAVSPYGEILTYKNPFPAVSAIDKDNRNVKHLLNSIDETYYEGYNGSYVTINFGDVDVSQDAKLIIRSDPPPPQEEKSPIYIQTMNSSGEWQTVGIIHTRVFWSTDIIDMSDYLPDCRGNLKVRLRFVSNDRIDFVALETSPQAPVAIHEGQLVSAIHSIEGDVTSRLLFSDETYTELVPEQQIELKFTLPEQTTEARSYIIVVKGRYYTITSENP